jgi:hypothetical protein
MTTPVPPHIRDPQTLSRDAARAARAAAIQAETHPFKKAALVLDDARRSAEEDGLSNPVREAHGRIFAIASRAERGEQITTEPPPDSGPQAA